MYLPAFTTYNHSYHFFSSGDFGTEMGQEKANVSCRTIILLRHTAGTDPGEEPVFTVLIHFINLNKFIHKILSAAEGRSSIPSVRDLLIHEPFNIP